MYCITSLNETKFTCVGSMICLNLTNVERGLLLPWSYNTRNFWSRLFQTSCISNWCYDKGRLRKCVIRYIRSRFCSYGQLITCWSGFHISWLICWFVLTKGPFFSPQVVRPSAGHGRVVKAAVSLRQWNVWPSDKPEPDSRVKTPMIVMVKLACVWNNCQA